MKTMDELIEDMLCYKESLGRKRNTYDVHLHGLADFVEARRTEDGKISLKNDIAPWCLRRDTESPSGFRRRLAAVRELTKYLFAVDICDRVLPLDDLPVTARYSPYIFSDEELHNLFHAAESASADPCDPFSANVLHIIYKVIYFCGLRPNEGRELLRDDYDCTGSTLFIRHNKAGRERCIPIGKDLAALCDEYLETRDRKHPESPAFFPSPDGGFYSAKWLGRRFQSLWKEACPDSSEMPRVYDLRHRYATAVMTGFLKNGADLFSVLPYLRSYMGHAEFSSTAYYIHLLPEHLKKSAAIDWEKFENLLPEVECYE